MQHSVQKQGKYWFNTWRQRKLVTHDTAPYVYLGRKTHTDSVKMSVEQVQLWPHFDPHLLPEGSSSMAAICTVVLRGRLLPLTGEDALFLAAVSLAADKKAQLAASAKKLMDASLPPSEDDGPAGLSQESLPHPPTANAGRSGENGENCGGDEEGRGEERPHSFSSPHSDAPAYTNPLLCTPSQWHMPPSQVGGGSLVSGGPMSQSMGPVTGVEEFDGMTRDRTARSGTGGKSAAHTRVEWVIRCATPDSLRSLVHALQGVESDFPGDSKASGPRDSPVPLGCFQGSLAEIEQRLQSAKKKKSKSIVH